MMFQNAETLLTQRGDSNVPRMAFCVCLFVCLSYTVTKLEVNSSNKMTVVDYYHMI